MVHACTTSQCQGNKAVACRASSQTAHSQRGMTLLELLVGITLGTMVIAAALGTLVMSKAVTGTTSEVAALQQNAGFALTVMGRLIRQAGSLEPVQQRSSAGLPMVSFEDRTMPIVSAVQTGVAASNSLRVGIQSGRSVGVNIDCFGNPVAAREFSTLFSVSSTGQLMCQTSVDGATAAAAQALIPNVRSLQVRYRIAQRDAAGRESLHVASVAPPNPNSALAPRVVAVELCLEMQGSERIQGATGNFINCQGASVPMAQNLRRVYRNVFYVRVS